MENIIKEFGAYTHELKLSPSVVENAYHFLNEIFPTLMHDNEISKAAMFACTVFVAVQDNYRSTGNSHPEITVSQLLEKSHINITEFFTVTCALKKKFQLSEKTKESLIALERKYLIVSALFDKFESMATEVFFQDSKPISNIRLSNSPQTTENCQFKSMCWLLFLIAKSKVMWHRQELLANFHLLLCCVGEVIRLTPSFLLHSPFDNAAVKNEGSLAILEVLSGHFRTVFEEVKAVNIGWVMVAKELNITNKLPEIDSLYAIYSKLYLESGDLDESKFLEGDQHLLPPNIDLSNSPRKQSVSIRRTLDSAEALNTILMSASDDVTESLSNYLKKCTIDAPKFIREFLLESKIKFINQFIKSHEGGDASLAERRFKLASRYYYIMLNALLKKETEHLSASELTSFIQYQIVQKSLLACCIEVTLMSCGSISSVNFTPVPYPNNNQVQGTVFPWILEVFDLEAFHFYRIIETFIRDAPTITMQIINHLGKIEDQILDSLAWKSGSTVLNSIKDSSGKLVHFKKRFHASSYSPNNCWSPNKNLDQRSPKTPHTNHAVNKFMNKVCRLAYHRLNDLCHLLSLDKDTRGYIWTCIEHVLCKKPSLLEDRHVDQIIMCCIFGLCRSRGQDITFKWIITCYSHLPYSSSSVCRQVLTEGKMEHITVFYNGVFSKKMAQFLVKKFGDEKSSTESVIHVSPSPSATSSPLYSLPNNKNIFISSIPDSPFKDPNEIIYQKSPVYTFGPLAQSSKTLQDINCALNKAGSSKANEDVRGRKRLRFDLEEYREARDSPVSAQKFLKLDRSETSFLKPRPKQ